MIQGLQKGAKQRKRNFHGNHDLAAKFIDFFTFFLFSQTFQVAYNKSPLKKYFIYLGERAIEQEWGGGAE